MHERRTSSQSMQSDMSNNNMQNMNRQFMPPTGRGRGFPNPQFGNMSPSTAYRQPNQQGPRPNMSQFQPNPSSPYMRTSSPAMNHQRPAMPPYSYPNQQVNPTLPFATEAPPHDAIPRPLRRDWARCGDGVDSVMQPDTPSAVNDTTPRVDGESAPSKQTLTRRFSQMGYNNFDPYGGYYQPYPGYQQYPGQPPQSPRPPYPSPYGAPQQPMNPPFNPPDMSRSASQSSQHRPPSSLGAPPTPSVASQGPSQTPGQQTAHASAFQKPKKSSAIKITDAQGNELNFNKPAPSPSTQAAPTTPVIVSTPNAPTPPPRVPSSQHNRAESKSTSTRSSEETKNAFQEQVKRQIEERKKQEEAEKAQAQQPAAIEKEEAAKPAEVVKAAEPEPVKEAVAEAEKPAAKAADDKEGEKAAEAAVSATQKADDEPKAEREETEEERMEREIAEMEAAEKEEEERERAYNEKKQKEKAEQAKRQAELDAKADEELKRQEREAEEREEARERERAAEKAKAEGEEPDEESKELFSTLKKSTLGPGASGPDSGTSTPVSEAASADTSMPPPSAPSAQGRAGAQKPKPAHLKLETNKRVEPSEPTPGMQALKSARFLDISEEARYPDGFKSPNPALNQASSKKGRAYDRDFLLQFQNVFKEKPSVDWDQKIKETLGADDPQSGRPPNSARSASARSVSGRPGVNPMNFGGPMGSFAGGPRTLPANTTSEQRFAASQMGGRPMGMPGQIGRAPSQFGMPGAGMSRTNSLQTMGNMGGPNSPRQPSGRGGKGASKRGDRTMSKKEEAEMAAKMPLTAHMEIAPLQKSTTGWKPMSLGQSSLSQPDLSGNLTPDVVQRKVKAALNKMTPENFDKISDQILEIANQSKTESDGRTLRQVIQLTFEKACDEAHWASMYAGFCHKMLLSMSPEIRDETIKDKSGNPVVGGALFRKYLLNRCQEEFERGWQANLPQKPEGESESKEAALLSDEYYVAAAAKRRGLGLIQFIGQLYKLKMLTLRIMHECVMRLLNFEGDPDEAAIENLTTLLRSVGKTMAEDPQGENLLTQYFERIDTVILKNDTLPSRPRFMVMDLVDLRKNNWVGKDKDKGPKTIEEIHQEAAAAQAKAEAERAKAGRGGPGGRPLAGRGDARQFSGSAMPPPQDYHRTTVGMDDLRRLQNRGASQRATGGGLGPGGSLGPSALSNRSGSRRGQGLGPPSSGNTTRTNTPPVDKDKKEDTPTQTNAFR